MCLRVRVRALCGHVLCDRVLCDATLTPALVPHFARVALQHVEEYGVIVLANVLEALVLADELRRLRVRVMFGDERRWSDYLSMLSAVRIALRSMKDEAGAKAAAFEQPPREQPHDALPPPVGSKHCVRAEVHPDDKLIVGLMGGAVEALQSPPPGQRAVYQPAVPRDVLKMLRFGKHQGVHEVLELVHDVMRLPAPLVFYVVPQPADAGAVPEPGCRRLACVGCMAA